MLTTMQRFASAATAGRTPNSPPKNQSPSGVRPSSSCAATTAHTSSAPKRARRCSDARSRMNDSTMICSAHTGLPSTAWV